MDYYILNDDNTIKVISNAVEWGKWFENAKNVIKATMFRNGTRISTAFLGINHSYDDGPPLLFETMTFNKKGEDSFRYATYDEAISGHNERVCKYPSEIISEEERIDGELKLIHIQRITDEEIKSRFDILDL